MKRDDKNGIDERSFRFYRDVLEFVETIPLGLKTNKIVEQLVGAAGSIGANREEALGDSSRREFRRFNEISLRGANESLRWLRTCAARRLGAQQQCVPLIDECRQLAAYWRRSSLPRKTKKRMAATTRRMRGPSTYT